MISREFLMLLESLAVCCRVPGHGHRPGMAQSLTDSTHLIGTDPSQVVRDGGFNFCLSLVPPETKRSRHTVAAAAAAAAVLLVEPAGRPVPSTQQFEGAGAGGHTVAPSHTKNHYSASSGAYDFVGHFLRSLEKTNYCSTSF